MKTEQDLYRQLKQIDHKSYGLYKTIAGSYQFTDFILHIDHVQGDPFASPSRLRVELAQSFHGFPAAYRNSSTRQTALEDALLRQFNQILRRFSQEKKGSGKSGLISTCQTGPEVLKRLAVQFEKDTLQIRFEMGLPAKGRTILANELNMLLTKTLPSVLHPLFYYHSCSASQQLFFKKAIELSDNQQYIRAHLKDHHCVAFLANGSILARENGVSPRPMKEARPFYSPLNMEISFDVPHGDPIRGMGVREGVTVIAGGGYHGKSTLLRAIESGVYDHIRGDGREYVITDSKAMKIRAEDGRPVHNCNISTFINRLPNGQDTIHFFSENASGSTSQAANMIEAVCGGSSVLLIDEDTSATNFMIRDSLMKELVSDDEEPITPFIHTIRDFYTKCNISTILVIGSSGDYLAAADTVLQLRQYEVRDVTEKARRLCGQHHLACFSSTCDTSPVFECKTTLPARTRNPYKLKTSQTDTILIEKETIDVRYLEQLCHSSQTIGIAYLIQYLLSNPIYCSMSVTTAVEKLYQELKTKPMTQFIPQNYPAGQPALPRPLELMSALFRDRSLSSTSHDGQ